MNTEKRGTVNGYWMLTLVFSQESHVKFEKIHKEFAKENIDARKFFGRSLRCLFSRIASLTQMPIAFPREGSTFQVSMKSPVRKNVW